MNEAIAQTTCVRWMEKAAGSEENVLRLRSPEPC